MNEGIGNEIISIDINVRLYPTLTVELDEETGELKPALSDIKSMTKRLKVLLGKDGSLMYPHNLYLHYLLSKRGVQDADTQTKALLLFSRWLDETDRSYTDIVAEPKEGVAWQFGDWLIDHHLRSIYDESGEVFNEQGLSISTAKSYMRIIIDFYKWLNREEILPWSDSVKPFTFQYIRISDYDASNDNHMLSHTFKRKALVVTTTDRMMSFPKVQSMLPWQKLKPLSPEDQKILEKYIANDDPKSLMVKLAKQGGLRISEVVTLSERAIYAPVGEYCKLTLDPADGVQTKGNKKRTTEIPNELMQSLNEYKNSAERSGILTDNPGQNNDRLFITPDGKALNSNTLHTFWSKLRKRINDDLKAQLKPDDTRRLSKKPLWYYRFHDLRSTFATEWLRLQQRTRHAPYDFYFNELKQLMGHERSTDTQKYIDFVNYFDVFSAAAARRNMESAQALRG